MRLEDLTSNGELKDLRTQVARQRIKLADAVIEIREQDKDAVFIALCEIARQWIPSAPEPPTEGG